MKKKLYLLLSFLLLSAILYAVELTSEQKNTARTVVEKYCFYMTAFAQCQTFIQDDIRYESCVENFPLITALCSGTGGNTRIYNDFKADADTIMVFDYLNLITQEYYHSLNFTYENIHSLAVETLGTPSPDKQSQDIYAILEIEKTIEGPSFNKKKVKNVFFVNTKDYKIYTIINPNSNSSPDYLWFQGLRNYKAKRYELALDNFKKAANLGDTESMYYCGVMYFKNWGCNNERDENGKKLNREKRDTKALEWYKKAAKDGHEEALRQIKIFW